MLNQRYLSRLYFLIAHNRDNLNIQILQQPHFYTIILIRPKIKQRTLLFIFFIQHCPQLKPHPYSHPLPKNPLWIVIKHLDGINDRVLDKVQVRVNVTLLDTGLDQAE